MNGLVASTRATAEMREVVPFSMRQPRESPAPARPGGATLADRSSHSIRPEQVEAILDGSEKITRKLLDAVDLDHAAQAPAPSRPPPRSPTLPASLCMASCCEHAHLPLRERLVPPAEAGRLGVAASLARR